MTHITGKDQKQEHAGEDPRHRSETSEHRHTGEGAASALAHLISQSEKHRRQAGDSDEALSAHG